jgi:DNA-binding MarR family transcriptional regulator
MAKIYEDIRQTRPFSRPEREIAVTLIRTADVFQHTLERALAPYASSPEQYNVLRILRGAGERGLPTLEIAARMLSRSPNITRMLDKLVAKQLARRLRSRNDRRVVLITLTPQGIELLQKLDSAVEQALDNFPQLSKPEMQNLVTLLDRIREEFAVKTVKERSREKFASAQAVSTSEIS